jgi:hypothetical protein
MNLKHKTMKKYLLLFLSIFIFSSSFAQEAKKEIEKEKTKMEAFASKTGTIIKFTDVKLSGIKASYIGLSETRIRKITSTNSTGYFFQIEKTGKYDNSTASIEYTDLVEIIKALLALKTDVDRDIISSPDYLENKFTTVDGFQVGYYISKGKATWFIKLDKYGSENTLYIESYEIIETSFNEAKNKIDELKKTTK